MNALLLIDIQNDFLPGGSLEVQNGDRIIPVVNGLQESFETILATQDWHPAGHGSFASSHPGKKPGDRVDLDGIEQILWPDHCVQGTVGARISENLDQERITEVVKKGTDPRIDSYSGFFDNMHRRATGLHNILQARGIGSVTLAGLATDFCVRFTALDALELGYSVSLIEDGTMAVGGKSGFEATLEELRYKGVSVVSAAELMQRNRS